MNWTIEQITSFAPDTGTVNRGKKLAIAKKWPMLGKSDRAIWGECKGSGANPYQTGVDFHGPAFRCSCPVRKPPCKHVIGLMMLHANQEDAFSNTTPPGWMGEWLTKRDARLAKAAAPVATKPITENEEDVEEAKKEAAKLKRYHKRIANMKAGMEDLEVWLNDLLRQGLASLDGQPYSFWEDIAKRMVDAQSLGLANMIKEIPLLLNSNLNWADNVLNRLGELYLVIKAFQQLEKFDEPTQENLKAIAGLNTKKADILAQEGIKDDWMILGQRENSTTNENIRLRKTWLWGINSGKPALILDFTQFSGAFEVHYNVGTIFKGELVYYPGTVPLRAIVKKQYPANAHIQEIRGVANFDNFLTYYAQSISANPWIMEYPCPLSQVIPIFKNEKIWLIDEHKNTIPVIDKGLMGWQLIALSGGEPISVFGEWTGEELMLLSASNNGRFMRFE